MEKKSRFSWLIILCCVVPMALILFFLTGGIERLGWGNLNLSSGSWLILLLCPLMHIGMLVFMKGGCHGDDKKAAASKDSNCHKTI